MRKSFLTALAARPLDDEAFFFARLTLAQELGHIAISWREPEASDPKFAAHGRCVGIAKEIAELYHQRWELEVAFNELKTDMVNREECLRIKAPEGTEQEIWSVLLTYNLIRREMALTAQANGAKPSGMSFKASMPFIHFFICHASDPATVRLPERLRKLREDLWRYRLPARRVKRTAPRHVKMKMSAYPKKPGRRSVNA